MKINKDLTNTMINSLWRVISGPVMLLAIPFFLTPLEQGYWYTFSGLAALSIFADLGFTTIVLQFSAHEFAYLKFGKKNILIGDNKHLWKLSSFFRFTISWLRRIVCIVFPLIMIGGYIFLSLKPADIHWQIAWILYSIASAGAFFNSALMSFFEGCNSVGLLQSVRFRVAVCSTLTSLFGLAVGWNIYALSLSLLVNVLIGMTYIVFYFSQPIRQMWKISSVDCYDWWPEFSSLIWRYAISWCSGYFIFQLFTPLAFHFHGVEFSGKIGISIAMWTAGFSIANTWITAIMPRMNMLVSERKWPELDCLFQRNLIRTLLTMFLGGISYFVLYYLLGDSVSFFRRVLDPFNMFILFISWMLQMWVNSIASYLRAHKKEPLMQISFISGIWVAITTVVFAKFFSQEYMFMGFLSQFAFSIPVVYRIYRNQRRDHTRCQIQ